MPKAPDKLSLDIAAPRELPRVLRAAAESYSEAAWTVAAAWQSPAAGRIWRELGKCLERAADTAERAVQRAGLE